MPIELGKVVSLPDVLLQDHFSFLIPNPPGGGSGEALEILNMSAVLPGRNNNPIRVELHRHATYQAGKTQYGHQLQATYVDTADLKVTTALQAWQRQISDPATNLPRPKSEYLTTGVVRVYGADNRPVILRTLYNLWLASLPDQQLNGSSNSPLVFSVTFNYDYWLPGGF